MSHSSHHKNDHTDSAKKQKSAHQTNHQSTHQNSHQSNQNQADSLTEKVQKAKKEADENRQNQQESLQAEDKIIGEIEELKAKLEEMTEINRRLLADMQNQKRRAMEDGVRTIRMANSRLIKELLPTIDTLERALEHLPEGHKEGLQICLKQIKDIFIQAGLTEIPAENQPFNPDFHEALIEGPGPKNQVIEVFEKGYLLGDRVIRHSKVKVGNGEEKSER